MDLRISSKSFCNWKHHNDKLSATFIHIASKRSDRTISVLNAKSSFSLFDSSNCNFSWPISCFNLLISSLLWSKLFLVSLKQRWYYNLLTYEHFCSGNNKTSDWHNGGSDKPDWSYPWCRSYKIFRCYGGPLRTGKKIIKSTKLIYFSWKQRLRISDGK